MIPKNILALRNDRFGEFLLNIPAFKALKQTYPEARLTVVVNPYVQEIAQCLDCIDEVIPWENKKHTLREIIRFSSQLRKERFDTCIILNPSKEFNIVGFLSGIPVRVGYDHKWAFLLTHKTPDKKYLGDKHEVEYNLDLAGVIGAKLRTGSKDKNLSLNIPDDIINKFPGVTDLRNSVVIHPFTSDMIKQWPIERFCRLAQKLIQALNLNVILIGGKEELARLDKDIFNNFKHPNLINLIGQTSLKELTVLLKKSRLLVSADSGPIHLASCVETPVIAIFRNDIPAKRAKRWGPLSKNSYVLEKNNLSDISVDDVFDKVIFALGIKKGVE
ncbi:MAG: glycosyltransferase family 9 protein [Candidatus Omnitrophota bacterium]